MKGFSTLDNPNHEGETNTWLTPPWLLAELGHFDLDPCGHPAHWTARRMFCLPSIDGFKQPWPEDERIWLNPPYGKEVGKWLERLQEHNNGIALVFSRTDTRWFQKLKPDLIFAISGRIRFLKPDLTESTNAGHGSMLLAFGRKNAGAILSSNLKGVWLK